MGKTRIGTKTLNNWDLSDENTDENLSSSSVQSEHLWQILKNSLKHSRHISSHVFDEGDVTTTLKTNQFISYSSWTIPFLVGY